MVSRNCKGVHLAQALEALDIDLALFFSASIRSAHPASRPRPGHNTRPCPRRYGTAAASRQTRGPPPPAGENAGRTGRRSGWRYGGRRIRIGENADLVIAQAGEVVAGGSTPMATEILFTSCEARISWESTSQVLRILPAAEEWPGTPGPAPAWREPPAESPSTRNNSPRVGSSPEQSASLPGSAGPEVTACAPPSWPIAGGSGHY